MYTGRDENVSPRRWWLAEKGHDVFIGKDDLLLSSSGDDLAEWATHREVRGSSRVVMSGFVASGAPRISESERSISSIVCVNAASRSTSHCSATTTTAQSRSAELRRIESRVACSDFATCLDDRLAEAAAIEQRFVQIERDS